MLTQLSVEGFKCFDHLNLRLAPLTLLVGTNASGKSTVIQSIMLHHSAFEQKNGVYLKEIVKPYAQFEDVASRLSHPSEIIISIESSAQTLTTRLTREGLYPVCDDTRPSHVYEQNLFYLTANRTGPQEIAEFNRELRIGDTGQYALGYLEQRKDTPIHPDLVERQAPALTLKAQLAWWLSFITGTDTEARTEKITSTSVKAAFIMGEMGEVSPYNTGAGNGFLLKLGIMCLTAVPGDLLLIENPEIHLHPAAQSRLARLFAHLSAHGVQLIVETHCEHLINRIRYEVYSRNLSAEDLIIHYKPRYDQPFETLHLNQRGHYCETDGQEQVFPSGFFDSTLRELLEIG